MFLCFYAPYHAGAVIFVPSEKPSPTVIKEEVYEKDLVLQGSDRLVVSNKKLTVRGNIYLKDRAELILDNVILEVQNYPEPSLILGDNSLFVAKNSVIRVFGRVQARGNAKIDFKKVVFVNRIDLKENAKASIEGSWIFEDRFGGISVQGASKASLINTVIGGIELDFSGTDGARVKNLRPGTVSQWSSKEAFYGSVPWFLQLENVEVKDNPGHRGPYELGWSIIADSQIPFVAEDSTMNRMAIRFRENEVEFEKLLLRVPVTSSFGAVSLRNVAVQGEWRLIPKNSKISITDSQGVALYPTGSKSIDIKNSEIVEFVADQFTGKVFFEDSTLIGPLWIFDESNLSVKGSVIFEELDPRFDRTSRLSKEISLVLRKGSDVVEGVGGFVQYRGARIGEGVSDNRGVIVLEMPFDEDTFRESKQLTVEGKDFFYQDTLSIFTSTPFVIDLGPRLDLENFSFGFGEAGNFYVETFIVNRGTEAGKNIEVTLDTPGFDLFSQKKVTFERLQINQEEPIVWDTSLPRRGAHNFSVRMAGDNFPTILKTYSFERDENSIRPVILDEEFFDGETNAFSFWACDEKSCFKSSSKFRVEEKGGDFAVRGSGRGFALLNAIYGEEFFSIDFFLERGSANVNFRSKPLGGNLERYFVTVSPATIALTRQKEDGFRVLAQEKADILAGEWHTLGVFHKDGHIEVSVDEKKTLIYFDEAFLEEGIVSVEPLEGSVIWFDDVVLKGRKYLPQGEANPLMTWFIILLIPFGIFVVSGFAAALYKKITKR